MERRRARLEAKLQAKRERAIRKGKELPDSSALSRLDSLLHVQQAADSLARTEAGADSLSVDSLAAPAVDSAALAADTVRRVVKGYRNVKIYRTDFQAVCDSLTAQSLDSTLHLYIRPVIWNGENQNTSEVMDLYTERQQLQRAEFVGEPMMVSRIDTLHYNQIAGKRMTAFFRENKIFRNDVNGNVRTIFYVEDGEPAEVTMMSTVESGDASFYIEENQVVWIVYRNEIEDAFYPLDQVPATQEPYLKGFSWEIGRAHV